MPQAIEFHDSEVLSITEQDQRVVIEMVVYLHVSDGRPAFDRGTGWTQHASLTLEGATVSAHVVAPFGLVDGLLVVGEQRFDNLVPLPFEAAGEVRLELISDIRISC